MPYMRVSLTQKLTPEKAGELNKRLSEAFEVLPGKTRDFIIIELEDGKPLFFRSEFQKDFIFADIHYAGKFAFKLKNELTVAIFGVFESVLGTAKENASLKITEHQSWGALGELHDTLY